MGVVAKAVLARVAEDHPLDVDEIQLVSTKGQVIATRTGMLFAPGILLDGQPFGFGRLSERKLRGLAPAVYRGVMLGLPDHISACLFDLDGVLTPTAEAHKAAWAETFDAYLAERAQRTGQPFTPFDPGPDYLVHVDGKKRADGVRSFLASRGITLPDGAPDDPPEAETVGALGNRKNQLVMRWIRERGVAPYPGSVAYLDAAQRAGLRRAVVSASANCREVLATAGIADRFEVRVDGLTARAEGLRGKPYPDAFLAAAGMLGVPAAQSAVFEDALAGVAAGHAGGFGWVVGVDRVGQADALKRHGADIVVRDLVELLPAAAPEGA
jgi:beta-phosphoglucomutase family hydrolase